MRRLLFVLAAGAVACTSASPPSLRQDTTPTTSVPPAEVSTLDAAPTTTAGPRSTATVGVGPDLFELDVTCYAPGAGDLVAIGIGRGPDDRRVDLLVQAVFGEPYVSIGIGDRLIESSLDDPLVLEVDDGIIRGQQIAFVENLDLVTGDHDAVGLGFVRVECRQFESGLPPGY